jgi:hypothetical protein
VPGTAQLRYAEDNLGAARGRLPDAALRRNIAAADHGDRDFRILGEGVPRGPGGERQGHRSGARRVIR